MFLRFYLNVLPIADYVKHPLSISYHFYGFTAKCVYALKLKTFKTPLLRSKLM